MVALESSRVCVPSQTKVFPSFYFIGHHSLTLSPSIGVVCRGHALRLAPHTTPHREFMSAWKKVKKRKENINGPLLSKQGLPAAPMRTHALFMLIYTTSHPYKAFIVT